jgi:hypothetical protein
MREFMEGEVLTAASLNAQFEEAARPRTENHYHVTVPEKIAETSGPKRRTRTQYGMSRYS